MTVRRAFALLLFLPFAAVQGEAGRTVFGEVVDEAGRPAAGIAVELVREERTPYGGVRGEVGPYRAVTGPEGRFEIPSLPAGVATLGIARPGFPLSRARRLRIPEGAGRTDVGRLELPAGRTIAGRALNPQGQPLAGVEVWVAPPGDSALQATWKRQTEAGPQAVTGPDGRFSIPNVEKRARLVLCRASYRSTRPAESGDVTLQPFVRVPRARIAGRVVTASGEPVTGARVAFELMIGCGTRSLEFDPCPPEEAPEKGIVLTGRVLDAEPSHRPSLPERFREQLLKISVSARPIGGEWQNAFVEVDGTYYFESLSPGEWEVIAYALDRRHTERVVLEPGMKEAVLDLRLSPAHEIRGRLVDGEGRPVRGHLQILAESSPDDRISSAGSQEDGSFITWVQEGAYILRATAPGFAPGKWMFNVNGPLSELEVRLEEEVVLRGRLLGIVPGNLTMVATRGVVPPSSVRAAPDGTYRLTGLGPGTWEIEATHWEPDGTMRHSRFSVEIAPGSPEVVRDVDLAAGDLVLSGRLFVPNEEPVSASLQLVRADGAEIRWSGGVSPDGEFRIPGLAPGRYRIEVTDTASNELMLAREVEIDGDREVEIDLTAGPSPPPRPRPGGR